MQRIFILISAVVLVACSESTKQVPKPTTQVAAAESKIVEVDTSLLKYLLGKFDPTTDKGFVKIDVSYADREGMFLQKEAYQNFIKMYMAAKAEGIDLQIRSATRNFDYQKGIWERKWTGETILSSGDNASLAFPEPIDRATQILMYSSMPGTSRHHWGTDIDLNSFDNSYFESGDGLRLFEWLESNAHLYGYCRPYTAKDEERPHGYNEEKWHWSYTPLSDLLTKLAESEMTNEMITGFMGSEVAPALDVVRHYVLGINRGCSH